jgi:hypothetical protein
VLKGKSNTPPSTTASCGLGKGEEVKTERKKLFIHISKNHSGDYVGRGNKKIKRRKNRHRVMVIVICV